LVTSLYTSLEQIDCAQKDWPSILETAIQEGREIKLLHFNYPTDGELCQRFAISHGMHFILDPKAHTGSLKRLL
jgi:hypothetical protein